MAPQNQNMLGQAFPVSQNDLRIRYKTCFPDSFENRVAGDANAVNIDGQRGAETMRGCDDIVATPIDTPLSRLEHPFSTHQNVQLTQSKAEGDVTTFDTDNERVSATSSITTGRAFDAFCMGLDAYLTEQSASLPLLPTPDVEAPTMPSIDEDTFAQVLNAVNPFKFPLPPHLVPDPGLMNENFTPSHHSPSSSAFQPGSRASFYPDSASSSTLTTPSPSLESPAANQLPPSSGPIRSRREKPHKWGKRAISTCPAAHKLTAEELEQRVGEARQHLAHVGRVQCRWDSNSDRCSALVDHDDLHIHLGIRHHLRTSAAGLNVVACQWGGQCGEQMLENSVEKHIFLKHLNVSVRCESCGKSFARAATLRAHLVGIQEVLGIVP
ncbi:hypothetical protein R3P38DRAFT_3275040 [Favolaschia claudopus]|uniref:C2H2-type domain-containing protein n=1 Tax=Favolaschia claudopus TaxID=2862362 RepID=A0AAW0AUI6_9AGAR